MDKTVIAGTTMAAGGGLVNGYSIQEMLLCVVIMLMLCLMWQIGYAVWNCNKNKKRLNTILAARRSANGKPS